MTAIEGPIVKLADLAEAPMPDCAFIVVGAPAHVFLKWERDGVKLEALIEVSKVVWMRQKAGKKTETWTTDGDKVGESNQP